MHLLVALVICLWLILPTLFPTQALSVGPQGRCALSPLNRFLYSINRWYPSQFFRHPFPSIFAGFFCWGNVRPTMPQHTFPPLHPTLIHFVCVSDLPAGTQLNAQTPICITLLPYNCFITILCCRSYSGLPEPPALVPGVLLMTYFTMIYDTLCTICVILFHVARSLSLRVTFTV